MARALLWIGGLLALTGIIVIQWASPSPHGYIEVFLGLPLAVTGIVVFIVGLVLWYRAR